MYKFQLQFIRINVLSESYLQSHPLYLNTFIVFRINLFRYLAKKPIKEKQRQSPV